MNLKVVIEEGGVRGQDLIYCYIVIMNDYPPPLLGLFHGLLSEVCANGNKFHFNINFQCEDIPGSTHGDLDRGLRKLGRRACPVWTPPRFVWQVQHLELARLDLCGRRGTFSTFIEVCGSLATSLSCVDAPLFCGRCSTWSSLGSICVAGVALSVPSYRSAEAWRRACPVWTPARFVWQVQHLELYARSFLQRVLAAVCSLVSL